jgi:hypothetical protein
MVSLTQREKEWKKYSYNFMKLVVDVYSDELYIRYKSDLL